MKYPEAEGDIETDSDYEDDCVESLIERCMGPPSEHSSQIDEEDENLEYEGE